jgi:putative hydrolase of the HAD superfamily
VTAIRNVVFDFGGVLVQWRPDKLLADQFPDEQNREIARREIFGHPDWLEFDRGTLLEADAITRFAARSGFSEARLRELFGAIREELQPKQDSVTVLRGLAARAVPLYGLSNMSADIFHWLRDRNDFFALFNGIVVSGCVGLIKPEPAIFAHLATTHALVRGESLFIDDMPANVSAAREAGFQAVRFTTADALAAVLERLVP